MQEEYAITVWRTATTTSTYHCFELQVTMQVTKKYDFVALVDQCNGLAQSRQEGTPHHSGNIPFYQCYRSRAANCTGLSAFFPSNLVEAASGRHLHALATAASGRPPLLALLQLCRLGDDLLQSLPDVTDRSLAVVIFTRNSLRIGRRGGQHA